MRMSTLLEEVRKFSVDEAVSPAQQAAIAISKKERGEKPKEEGNAFGMALKSARDKGDKTFVVSGKTYNVEDYDVQEDGHTDVASAQNNVKVAMSALTKMSGELAKLNPEDALPSWWTNKVAVAVDKLDGMADYLDTQVEALDTEDEPKVKEIIKKLKGASKAHAGQADDLEKAVKEEVELDEKENSYTVVHVKKGKEVVKAKSSYEAAKKFAQMKGLKNTSGVDAHLMEEVELDEMKSKNYALAVKGKIVAVGSKAEMMQLQKNRRRATAPSGEVYMSPGAKVGDMVEEVELDEAKYDLYHKDFSSAMQHAYAMAKKLHGVTIDPKEIDDKVATGPKKPSKGKTNSYRLKGKGGAIQVQVANLDDKKFELNMYKEEVELPLYVPLDEMKMNDPKLLKMFDKLKRGDKIKLKTSSTISKGKDFVEYIVKSKNTVNKGRVEKITLATVGNEGAVKKFLYKRDGTVGFAIGDMGASIDDIKEETELDEAVAYKFAAVDRLGKVIGFASDERDAKDMARRGHTMDSPSKGKGVVGRNSGRVVTLKKPLSPKKGDMMINRPFPDDMDKFPTNTSATQGKRMGEEVNPHMDAYVSRISVDEGAAADARRDMRRDPDMRSKGDTEDDTASDKDVEKAANHIIMQLRKSVSMNGQKNVEFASGTQKVPPQVAQKILDMYNKQRTSADKSKFQMKIAKSYKDLLTTVKGR